MRRAGPPAPPEDITSDPSPVSPPVRRPTPRHTGPRWRGDRLALFAQSLACAANLALYAYLWRQLERLPPLMPLHYDAVRTPDAIGAPGELFAIPLVGTLILLANLLAAIYLHRWDPLLARFLVAGAVLVQLLLAGAALGIVARAAG